MDFEAATSSQHRIGFELTLSLYTLHSVWPRCEEASALAKAKDARKELHRIGRRRAGVAGLMV